MTNNSYRAILGAIMLVSLYADIEMAIYALVAIVLFEGITNWRIPKIVNRVLSTEGGDENLIGTTRFNVESERMFRITVGGVLLATYPLGPESMLWFVPWFMGFVFLGAGVSGICPAILLFKLLGFR